MGAAGAYLVVDEQYEYISYTVVDVHTGETTGAEGVPRFAPDNRTFFVQECEGGCLIAVRSTASPKPPLWESNSEKNGVNGNALDFVRWIDNDQVALRGNAGKNCPGDSCATAVVKRDGTSWTFLENAPTKSDAGSDAK